MSLRRRIAQLFSSGSSGEHRNLDAVQSIIEYRFKDRALLRQALSHRSSLRVSNAGAGSNERLEFLGDSVLGVVIAHQLYLDHPEMNEGDLTKTKALLVNETTLAEVGKMVGLNQHICLSPDEERSGGKERASIIADCVESVIGAVYLDGGFQAASNLILKLIYVNRGKITEDVAPRNHKGELLEIVQANSSAPPRYEVLSEEGPDHIKTFRVGVFVSDRKVGEGTGASKKEAEQDAAGNALEQLKGETK